MAFKISLSLCVKGKNNIFEFLFFKCWARITLPWKSIIGSHTFQTWTIALLPGPNGVELLTNQFALNWNYSLGAPRSLRKTCEKKWVYQESFFFSSLQAHTPLRKPRLCLTLTIFFYWRKLQSRGFFNDHNGSFTQVYQ